MTRTFVGKGALRDGAAAFLLAVAALTAGCAQSRAGSEEVAQDATLLAEVQNQTPYDVTLWAANGAGARRRLGTLTSQGTGSYEVPRSVVTWFEEIYLYANPVGPGDLVFRTRAVRVSPGQSLFWQILNNRGLSNIIVRGARIEPPPE